ncbi:tRNA epoxyqueuosine(34) reductase QueG [Mesorhizobium sp. NPDC059054]|uniref:tRNA epoxyqueuosine(34) reductase QueG n=1 Tax=Mesorhizobium sp. NPDC059054 TaxID=3346711 RepID=UPI0036B69AE2
MRTSISDPTKLRRLIDREARRAGFDAVAITTPDAIPQAPVRLAEFLSAGFHGSMGWMADTLERRADPSVLWPDVRSIVVLAMNYGPDHDPRALQQQPDRGAISVYARNRDYHDVIKGRLKEIAGKIVAAAGGDVKVFVDTAPVMEKPLAEAAGLGWQGKHTNLVSREHGSWLFLGTIFTTAELEPDAAEEDHCGSCRACLDACPTDAFPAPYRLDARRCISYLTIENKGPIPWEFRAAIGNRIYGCDDCLAACPWNKFAQAASEAKLVARADLREPALADLLKLDDAGFRALFSGSPVKRIGRDRFIRNVLIAAGNSDDQNLVAPVRERLDDASPLVRGAAVWALSRLIAGDTVRELAATALPHEDDTVVQNEWRRAIDEADNNGRAA